MNFLLSDEQTSLQDSLARLVEEECDLRAVHKVIDANDAMHAGLWSKMVEFGAAGTVIADEHGGLGLEMIDLALIAEVLGRKAAPTPFLGHALAGIAISLAGSDAQKKAWLPKLAAGEAIGSVAFGEGAGLWLPAEWQAAGEKKLSGTKDNVPSLMSADLVVVGLAGGALALVETEAAGVSREPLRGVDRTRPIGTLQLSAAAADPLPGGQAAVARLRDAALVLLAADAYGGASRCVEMASEYAKVREQFGKKIAEFQALRHQLAMMAVEAEPGRGLYWYAAHAWDHIQDKAEQAAALAKAHLTERYLQVARDNIKAHGGIGFTWEYDAHLFLKRAMFDFAWGGAPAVHRQRYADLVGW
jgi:alkylation response protein AidB-like acyl-CoA dehydrogenase